MKEPSVNVKAEILLAELLSRWLSVAKWPSLRGGYVRGATSVNAEWYSRFCRSYSHRHSRRYPKVRTFIKRGCTIKALERLVRGDNHGVYAARLLDFIENWTRQWKVDFTIAEHEYVESF